MMKGLVIKSTGSWYTVRLDATQELISCKVKGNFRIRGIRTTNPVAVGDIVAVALNDSEAGYITEIIPRKNYIIRKASNLSKESQIIAANIDCVALVVTLAHPVTSTTFIDRFLVTAEAYSVPAMLVINKVDLIKKDDIEYLKAFAGLYREIGYDVIEVSAKTGLGINTLKNKLANKITLFSGNSGVGKSTLINDIIPGVGQRTAEISSIHDTGTHTTTFSEMFQLPSCSGWIIDTPGVKGFGTVDIAPDEVAHYFPEIFRISHECRYNNCTHTNEPGCAVLMALNEHYISESRYNSYMSILNDCKPDKYRKPF